MDDGWVGSCARREVAFISLLVASFATAVVGCGQAGSGAGCTTGMAIACACEDGRMGAQSCRDDGTYDVCRCAGSADGGVRGQDDGAVLLPDASGCSEPYTRCALGCFDTSRDEDNCGGCDDGSGDRVCAEGSVCRAGVCDAMVCPPPFLRCGDECVDPRADSRYCGATSTCTGDAAGADCGGSACFSGRCVGASCADLLRRGFSTGDGIYLIDSDGGGPLPPVEAYCDMTRHGGGWTLIYLLRNDVPRVLDPWWAQVGLGAGSELPLSPSRPAGASYAVGPSTAARRSMWGALGGGFTRLIEVRAELRRGDTTLFDLANPGQLGNAIAMGSETPPPPSPAGACYSGARVLSSMLGAGIAVDALGEVCEVSCASCPSSDDFTYFQLPGMTGGTRIIFAGDTSAGPDRTDTHVAFWIRDGI